jgi:predicted TIM-barrel fold metal-dependent hydrolase
MTIAEIADRQAALLSRLSGAVDCDVQITVPKWDDLLPYMEPFWRDSVVQRGIGYLEAGSYPRNAPFTVRADWRSGAPPSSADQLQRMRTQLLDRYGLSFAICNCLYGVQVLQSEDMAAAYARALNDWIAREWLDKEPRLRASIVVPMQNPEMAVREIDRVAADRRFVQVLMLVMGEMPLGKRYYWPIYEAAARHGLPIGVHAGSAYRHPVTGLGWPSYWSQDYFSQAAAFQTQLTSLITEGVFSQYPELNVVLSEGGFSWLPPYLWRLDKYWHGLRFEIPWVDRLPSRIVADNVRFTVQPVDAPPDPAQVAKLFEHLGSDELLLFATDYPHWQFDGEDMLPAGFPEAHIERMMVANPHATYSRLGGGEP